MHAGDPMVYHIIIERIHAKIRHVISLIGYDEVVFSVAPSSAGFGDLSCNAPFLLARQARIPPFEIAKRIAGIYAEHSDEYAPRAEAHPSGHLNFFFDHEKVDREVIRNAVAPAGRDVGSAGAGSTVTIEHTSVNPNKALHIGHVRNLVIGDSIARIMSMAGYSVNVLNYIDDSGLQVADIILGFTELGFSQDPPGDQKFDHYCGEKVYVGTTERYQRDASLEERRKQILYEIEEGTSKTAQLAKKVTTRVLRCQLETCWRLAVSYDCLNFESQILRSGLWTGVFNKMKEMRLIEYETEGENTGCWVIRGGPEEDDKVLVRSNGTATYVAKDIPYAAWKLGLLDDPFSYTIHESAQPDGRILWQTSLNGNGNGNGDKSRPDFTAERVITVIDSRQARLQKIVTDLMTRFKASDSAYVHLGYESVALSPETASALGLNTSGRSVQISGRKGLYISADSVLDLLTERAAGETRRRNPDLDETRIQHIAHELAVATIRYEMIKQDLDKVISFDMTRSMSLEGDTASYIQYSCVRAARVLEKAGSKPDYNARYDLLSEGHERDLVRLIGMFDMQVRDASENLSPKTVARYCYDLAVAFNGFYEHSRILGIGDEKMTNIRLCLVSAFATTMQRALHLIGISVPPRM